MSGVAIYRAHADFWHDYHAIPSAIQVRADKQFALLKANPQHQSLQFKRIGERAGREIWSVRVTLRYRVLAVRVDGEYVWFWISEHNVYGAILS